MPEQKKMIDVSVWKKILPYFKPYRHIIFTIIALNLCSAGIDIIFPLFQRYAINNFIMEGTLRNISFFVSV